MRGGVPCFSTSIPLPQKARPEKTALDPTTVFDILQQDAFRSTRWELNKPCKLNSTVVTRKAKERAEWRNMLLNLSVAESRVFQMLTQPVMCGCCSPPLRCSPTCTYGTSSRGASYSTPSQGVHRALSAKSPTSATEEPAVPPETIKGPACLGTHPQCKMCTTQRRTSVP